MEKTFEHIVSKCTVEIDGETYAHLENAYDTLVSETAKPMTKNECAQCILDFMSELLDRKRYIIGQTTQEEPSTFCENKTAIAVRGQKTNGCCKVYLTIAPHTPMATVDKAEAIVSAFTPYVAHWNKILSRIFDDKDRTTVIAKCMPKTMAEAMITELNTVPGIHATATNIEIMAN